MSDWGQGAKNNNIGWGQGAVNNDISWGKSHELSYSGDTEIVGGTDQRFIMVVQSDNAGTSATNQFTIPTTATGYNYNVATDDGYSATGITGDHTITFPTGAGTHEVYITGDFPKIFFADGGDKLKLLQVTNWGTYGITQPDQNTAFRGCANLTQIAGGGAWFDVVRFGGVMFVGVSLTSLPDDMTLPILDTGNAMFNNSGLEVLPSGMELPLLTIAAGMFGNNPLTDLPTVMKLPSLTQGANMFINVTINTTRYSQLLIDLESGNANNNVPFHGGNSKYNAAGEVARDALVARGWTITDGGLEL